MSSDLRLLIERLDSVRMQISAQKIFEEFVSRKPSESELEVAALASWLHEHTHGRPGRAA